MKRTIATRSTPPDVNRQTHRSDSEIHRAITNRDKSRLDELLKKGDKLCTGDGTNCFILAISNFSFTYIKTLLEIEPNGINAKNSDGKTLLTYVCENLEHAKYLIDKGADPHVITKEGDNILTSIAANQCKNLHCTPNSIEIIEYYLSLGVYPLHIDGNGNIALNYYILKYFSHPCEHVQHYCVSIVKSFLIQPILQNPNLILPCLPEKHPQTIVLQRILGEDTVNVFHEILPARQRSLCTECRHNKLKVHSKNFSEMFDLFLNSNLIETNFCITKYLKPTHIYCIYPIKSLNFLFSPLCLLFSKIVFLEKYNLFKVILKKMFDRGFKVLKVGFSPLSVLCMWETLGNVKFCSPLDQVPTINTETLVLDMARELIVRGADVAQRVIQCEDREMQDLSDVLDIPDSLLITLFNRNLLMLQLLLPYYGHPPLALLLVHAKAAVHLTSEFLVLSEHAGVPHGTPTFRLLQEMFKKLKYNNYIWIRIFEDKHSSPLSLKDLSRQAVRSCVYQNAAGRSLPDLLSSMCPPGLRGYLLMSPPQPLDVYVCDSEEIAGQINFNTYTTLDIEL